MSNQQVNGMETDEVLENLRRLIMQPEQDKITRLQQRFDDKTTFAEEISQVLPEAIIQSNKQDKQLDNALKPVIEESIKSSVTNDLAFFADALYPIMGPAIRKSIAEAFKELLQAVNVTLESSFSKQGLQWRWESIRTGRPFSEIVLLRSLIYRTEQVFLIHRETGCLLQHVAINEDDVQDADMVSGMLTAISDFAQDSFAVQEKATLNSFQIENLTVLIEAGPQAILAIAIRGNAPKSIRDNLHTALEGIHFTQSKNLSHFTGDAHSFEQSRPYLEDCLTSQYKEKNSDSSFRGIILIVIILLLSCWWIFSVYQDHVNWDQYLSKLRQEPGIVITRVSEQAGHFSIQGLRDPLAKRPQTLRTDTTPVSEQDISYQLEPYQALTAQFILQRAAIALAKPEHISLSLHDGILIAEGSASKLWQVEARKLAKLVAGVIAYDDSGVSIIPNLSALNAPETVSLTFNKGVLLATGSAPDQWILQARLKATLIAGINQYDDSGLANIEALQMKALVQQIEQKIILFEVNSYVWSVEKKVAHGLLNNIKQLLQLGKVRNKQVLITIFGHTDGSGSVEKNNALSQKRANGLYQYLVSKGIPETSLLVQGVGINMPLSKDPPGTDRNSNRSVTFSVQINDR